MEEIGQTAVHQKECHREWECFRRFLESRWVWQTGWGVAEEVMNNPPYRVSPKHLVGLRWQTTV